ncbi:hypothetical protein GOP47_0025172 [Adiantum capillus-veneris]|uniref:Uncharacterized protein n=1 Tax=Adiantum capillus-veneris TaxID=13818 RepID=A0A9D4U3J5_ADICA|nr:hypothetical protein GOP47_0025172 [Adiantum capillus-veneris]
MATLTRGVSFRRQGSSGISWAENWVISEDTVVVVRAKSGPLLKANVSTLTGRSGAGCPKAMTPPQTQQRMQRSRSTHESCSINYKSCIMIKTPINSPKSSSISSNSSTLVGWLKKAFTAKSEY